MRKVQDPLSHLLARAVRLESGCLVLPNHEDDTKRYPTMKAHGRTVKIPRFVYESEHGKTLAYVLHTCDYPPCFEITHLYEGTQSRNMLDMYERERRGEVDTRPHRDMSGANNPNYRDGLSRTDPAAYHRRWRANRRIERVREDG